MATSDQLNEINNLLRKIKNAYDNLGDENPFKNFNKQPIVDADAAIKQLQAGLDGVRARVQGTSDSFDTLYNVLKEVSKEINPKILNATKSLEGGMKGLVKEAQKLKFEEQGIDRFNKKQLEKIKEKFLKQQDIAKESAKELTQDIEKISFINKAGRQQTQYRNKNTKAFIKLNDAQRAALGILEDENDIQKDILSKINQRIRQEEEVVKIMGAAPAILGGIGKALQKIGLPDFGVQDAIDQSQAILVKKQQEYDLEAKINNTTRKKVSTSQAFNVIVGEIGKKIKAQFTLANALQSAFTFLVTSMIQLDKSTGQLAKNIGVSYDESLALQKEFNQIAISSDRIMVSSAALNKSFASLNQQFQGTTNFSKETLESFTALTAQAGISEETIGNIGKLTGTQGVELENNVALMQGELGAMNALNKTSFSTKQMLEDIGKINKSTLLILNQQPQALAKTLYTSRKLGLSFAEMESISSSMLDFESSIQNELEAELLTGKDLNLEQARLLALQGKVGEAAAEIAKQVGSAEKFGKMNVIQQEALAKAVGLTKDQLANSLIEQEAIVALSEFEGDTAKEKYENAVALYGAEEARRRLGNDILAKQMESQSVAERFGAAVERLKEMFISVGAAVMPIVGGIADAVVGVSKFIAKFSGLIKVMAAGYAIIKGIQLTTKGLIALNTTLGGIQLANNTASGQQNALQLTRIGLGQTLLNLLGLENAQLLYMSARQQGLSVIEALRVAANETILGSLIAQVGATIKNIGRLTIELGVRMGIMSAALATNAAATFGVGIAVAIAAATAGYFAIKALADDMIDPPTGYGKRALLDEGGVTLFNNKDTIVAGTNLLGDDVINDSTGTTKLSEGSISTETTKLSEGSISTEKSPSSQLLVDLNSKLDQLLVVNRRIVEVAGSRRQDKITVKMFGNEVGNGVQTDSRGIN